MRRRTFIAALGAAAAIPALAGAADPPTPAETLARLLERRYVYRETGLRYAAALRANAAAYAQIPDPAALATRLTADLAAVSPDRHLRVVSGDPRTAPPPPPAPGAPPRPPRGPPLGDVRWAAPGVAYIQYNELSGSPEEVAATQAFMRDYAGARALVLDGLRLRGGGIEEMKAFLPYLFRQRTVLVYMDVPQALVDAEGAPPDEGTALVHIPGPSGIFRQQHVVEPHPSEHRWFDTPVYYLVSGGTASAGEHLALSLKRTRRATLIGQTTAGANHFGGFEAIGAGLTAFIPVGRTLDPDTGRDWEGVGIAPDVVTPPDEALARALEMAAR